LRNEGKVREKTWSIVGRLGKKERGKKGAVNRVKVKGGEGVRTI